MKTSRLTHLSLIPLLLVCLAGKLAAGPVLVPKGIEFDAGTAGKFVISAPALQLDKGNEQPAFDVANDIGTAVYPSGAKVECKVQGDEVIFVFSNLPANARGFKFQLGVPLSFNNGGKYAFGANPPKDFPVDKGSQFIEQGSAISKFSVTAPTKDGWIIEVPTNWYGLQDNRLFNSNSYSFQFLYDLKAHPNDTQFPIKITIVPAS